MKKIKLTKKDFKKETWNKIERNLLKKRRDKKKKKKKKRFEDGDLEVII